DRDDVRMREAGRALRLAAEALDELLVVRVPVVEDLDRDPPPELLVLGEVDVRHSPGTEAPDHLVAPVEERPDQGVRYRHGPSKGRDFTVAAGVPASPVWRWGRQSSRRSRAGAPKPPRWLREGPPQVRTRRTRPYSCARSRFPR